MAKRKMDKAREREEELKRGAHDAKANYDFAK